MTIDYNHIYLVTTKGNKQTTYTIIKAPDRCGARVQLNDLMQEGRLYRDKEPVIEDIEGIMRMQETSFTILGEV